MCQIRLALNFSDPLGNGVTIIGYYRNITVNPNALWSMWTLTPVVGNYYTPDITIEGEYELKVKITDAAGEFSWFNFGNFDVGPSCTPTGGGVVDTGGFYEWGAKIIRLYDSGLTSGGENFYFVTIPFYRPPYTLEDYERMLYSDATIYIQGSDDLGGYTDYLIYSSDTPFMSYGINGELLEFPNNGENDGNTTVWSFIT